MPSLDVIVAGVIPVSLTFYALLGGADYGAGVWTLLARGPRRRTQQALIARAIGPIWEANHVWLILIVTVLFTAFPHAFAVISTRLHIPLTLMLIGIVLRGAAFAFRTYDVTPQAAHSQWQDLFAVASLVTPVLLGVTIGAIASGELSSGDQGFLARFVWPWLAPFPLAVGVFTLALFAFLAAVYLILETTDPALRKDFRACAYRAEIAVAVMALLVFALAARGAPQISRDLIANPWGWAMLSAAFLFGVGAVVALWLGHFGIARVCAAAQVSAILWGWALAQYPYLVEPDITIGNSAASPATLRLLLIALLVGAVILSPCLYYLFRVFKAAALGQEERPTPGVPK